MAPVTPIDEAVRLRYDDDDDTYTLSTGRTFYANNGIVGLSPVTYGHSGHAHMFAEGYDGHEYADDWSPAERQELAAFMVSLWLAWGQRG